MDFVAGVIIKEGVHRVFGLGVLFGFVGLHVRCRRFRAFPIRRQRSRQLRNGGMLREFRRLAVIVLGSKPGHDGDLIDRKLPTSKH